MCQPSILQERYAHEAIKVEVEPKQVNTSQIAKSETLFTNAHGIEDDEEGHTQGPDTPPDIIEYKDRKDAVKEDNLDPSTLKTSENITRIRLEVENNEFISANGKGILKNTTYSTNIRDLLNKLTAKQREPEPSDNNLAPNEMSIEGLINTSHKALVTVMYCEDDTKTL